MAQSLAAAVGILEIQAGLEFVPPSRLFIYYNSRAYHGAQWLDSGTYIRTAVKGLVKLGAPDEEYWKFSSNPLLVNRRPGWNPYMMGHGRRSGEYAWILDGGTKRVEAIQAALAAGYPVSFGTLVTKRFLNCDSGEPIDKPSSGEETLGGHALLIIGYKQDVDGVLFEVLNSWGTDWGQGGFCWMTEDYIKWALSLDFCIIRGWERLNRKASVSNA